MNHTVSHTDNSKQFKLKTWILFTFYGWLLGVVLVILLSSFLDSIGIEHLQFYVGLGMSTGVAMMQWFQLKKIIDISYSWVTVAAAGMGLPFLCIDILIPWHTPNKLIIATIFGTAILASSQTMQLKKFFSNSGYWFIGTAIGWILSTLVLMAVEYTMKFKGPGWITLAIALLNLIIILSGGFILGFFSGKAVQKMNRK